MGGGRLAPQERLPNLTRNQLKLRVQGSGVRPTWLSRPPLEGRAVTESKVLFISSHSLVWQAKDGRLFQAPRYPGLAPRAGAFTVVGRLDSSSPGGRLLKPSLGLLNFGPRDLVPIPSQPGRLRGAGRYTPAFRTEGPSVRSGLGSRWAGEGLKGKGDNLLVEKGASLNPWG